MHTKKIISLLLFLVCMLSLVACSLINEATGTKLTLDNYEQYLKVVARCSSSGISCHANSVTTNYDFNDVKLTVKVQGKYKIY